MSRSIDDDLEASPRRIEKCEPRLALSASLAGDLLLEWFESGQQTSDDAATAIDPSAADRWSQDPSLQVQSFTPATGPDVSPVAAAPNLFEQAAQLRQSRGLGGAGQTVAVIDSGVAYDHVSLGGGFGPGYRVVGGWDFAENDADPYDDGPVGFHGTHVSGLLVGDTSDFAGVVPDADLVALRVFDDFGGSQLQWIESALQWVHENQDAFESPITTVNLSIGAALSEASTAQAMAILEDELALLRQDDILVFAASGNFFGEDFAQSGVLYPASSPSVVSVGSIDSSGSLSAFSQRENDILVAAGRSITSAVPDHVFGRDGDIDDFAELDGTSQATPQVAGASILIRQAMIDQGLDPTADDVLARLREATVERVDPLTGIRYRSVDLEAAIGDHSLDLPPAPVVDRFDGDNAGQRAVLDLRSGIELTVDGVTQSLAPESDSLPIVIDLSGGDDAIEIIGGPNAERLIARPVQDGTSTLSTNDFQIELRGIETIRFDGGGGPDRATLYDSAGGDSLQSRPGQAVLEGVGFQFEVSGVPRVFVHSVAGGDDVAFLHDSQGDDLLSVRPSFTSLRNDDTFQLAYGFSRVFAYANAGGVDSAEIFDSAGDDTMSISAGRSIITGPGYHVSASGFESTVGHATGGGNDVARIYSDQIDSTWESTADRVQWTGGDGSVRIARGFERNEAFERFEPISLLPQSVHSATKDWFFEDAQARARREADATRAIFEALGR